MIETLNLEIVQVFSLNQNIFDFFYVHKFIWRLKKSSINFFVKYFFKKHIFICI